MQSRWNEAEAAQAEGDLALRAYSSRLIGQDTALVLHGGGNTSVKSTATDLFGTERRIIWVKASGFDLGYMGPEGFTALVLEDLEWLAALQRLDDPTMVNEVNRARLDGSAAAPSIEALVHAVLPWKYVDHSHADAVLTLSNTIRGAESLSGIYGDRVLLLPYVKPGFDLARQFREALEQGRLDGIEAVILAHHGVFTFADTARDSYEAMIRVVDEAERWLDATCGPRAAAAPQRTDPLRVAMLRGAVSRAAGRAMLSLPVDCAPPASLDETAEMTRRGTLTPEHVIHNKPFPAVIGSDIEADLAAFAEEYRAYFDSAVEPGATMLPPTPQWALLTEGGVRSFGPTLKRATVSRDVAAATMAALAMAPRLGGWQGLGPADLAALEYWALEQAKLARQAAPPPLAGRVALVSGAAAGIGLACARALQAGGAAVVGFDLDPEVCVALDGPGGRGVQLDLTDQSAMKAALDEVVHSFGGIDILVSNAGVFNAGDRVETLDDATWDRTLAVNLTSHRTLIKAAIPYLRHGVAPGIVMIGSRNVAAPGAGAAAYSVSKAGLTQLMRVLALELAPEGITVNAVHPDRVFDTKLWTPEALARSAKRYGMTISEYRAGSLLGREITSADVARAVVAFVNGTLPCTTGAQLPVDGGNDRVI